MQSTSLVLLSNQQSLQQALDIVANNIANANTTGFKREGIDFGTLVAGKGAPQETAFVGARSSFRDIANGPILTTGNSLDIALQGPGYLAVQTPEGARYTRAGALRLDTEGRLVTMAGYPVLGDGGGEITIPNTVTQINISADGTISAKVDKGTALSQLGKISVSSFEQEQAMKPEGGGLFSTTQAATKAENTEIVQGGIEQSNVEPVNEMTQMIKILRAYQQTATLIKQEDQRLSEAIAKLSKTTA